MNAVTQTRERSCPICEAPGEGAEPGPYSRGPWEIIACPACDFVYLRNAPEAFELEENLAWEKTFVGEQERRTREQPLMQWFDTKMRWRLHVLPRTEGIDILNAEAPSGPALELGCGGGDNLMAFEDRFQPYGIEISRGLAERARRLTEPRGGNVVHAAALDGLEEFPDGFFTAVLMRSYLEHDADARGVVHALYRKMAPGGIAAVKVPNYGSLNRRVMGAKWCGFRWPDHVNYFDKPHLRRLATEAGFSFRVPFLCGLPTDDNVLALFER